MATDQGAGQESGRKRIPAPCEDEPPAKLPMLHNDGHTSLKGTSSEPLDSSAGPTLTLRTSRSASQPIPNDTASVSLQVAYSEDKGIRPAMEDVAVIQLDARHPEHISSQLPARCCFMGVFDGHGGRQVAELVAEQLHGAVQAAGLLQVVATAAARATQGSDTTGLQIDVKAAKAAIVQGYTTTDTAVLTKCSSAGWADGACAVAVWVIGNTVLVSNVGDAKAVLARITDKDVGAIKAGIARALTLSKDHLAVYPAERTRIERAGGFVADGRLNGRMQVSRSFGDAALKSAGCICTPDVAAFELTPRDRFMLLGCDGFFSVFDPQDAVNMATKLLAEGREVKAVTNRLLNEAIRERKCKDNCTVMLMRFVPQETS